ncbi:MAG TPA: gamma-glutamylcyclotransferase family protein [Roseiarcus sp.]|nr:gamma-glutamylcyclotransferase family protein [Roseiarcus sp.]
MPLYFAYGANMDVEAMAGRCPRSKPLGLARLMRHRLAVMREGWLTATRDGRANVDGVLWDIALADMRALDRYEGLDEGLYVKAAQPVAAAGGAKRALIYFGTNCGPGVAQADYLAGVLLAARRWNLPAVTIAQLEGFAAEAGVAAGAPKSKPVRPRFATPLDRP